MTNVSKHIFRLSLLAGLVGVGSTAAAAGFMLQEQNAVQTGDFGAGGAAIAEDASTAFYNPAGLVRIKQPQLVLAANYIQFNTTYSGNVNFQNNALPAGFNTTPNQEVSNENGGTGNVVPAFHAAYPINDRMVAGFSVVTPMGLSTNYETDSYVKYNTTETSMQIMDYSPSFGYAITKKFSVGLGLDFEHLNATLSNYATLIAGNENFGEPYDTLSENKATAWGYGYHAGLLYQMSPRTRFGLAYHSQVAFDATGNSTFTGDLAQDNEANPNVYSTNTTEVKFRQPANTMLSAFHDFGNAWSVMGSVTYTQWGSFNNLNMQNVMVADSSFEPELIDVNIPQNFHNTWRFSTGVNYRIDEDWLLRAGVGYDQSPTNNTDRNLRLPDEDRYATSLGAHYQITKMVGLDGGWTHEFIENAHINNTEVEGTQTTTVNGTSENSADVIGLQVTWSFA